MGVFLDLNKDAASPRKLKHCFPRLTTGTGLVWATHTLPPVGKPLLNTGQTMGQNRAQWGSWELRKQTHRHSGLHTTTRETRRQETTY